jgi:hypothetical protein
VYRQGLKTSGAALWLDLAVLVGGTEHAEVAVDMGNVVLAQNMTAWEAAGFADKMKQEVDIEHGDYTGSLYKALEDVEVGFGFYNYHDKGLDSDLVGNTALVNTGVADVQIDPGGGRVYGPIDAEDVFDLAGEGVGSLAVVYKSISFGQAHKDV